MTGPAEQHLDLDALADVLAEEGPAPEHLRGCARCAAELAALRAALGPVEADLAALPPVPPVPEGLDARLRSAVTAAGASSTTVLPGTAPTTLEQARSRRRVLAAAGGLAAAAVLVVGGALLLHRGGSGSGGTAASARSTPTSFPVSSTGSDYRSNAALQAALPRLLSSRSTLDRAAAPKARSAAPVPATAGSAASGRPDPLAALRTPQGLASCLAGLSDPTDPGVPLALDYAAYKGSPALVVVLPSTRAGKVDVWVVGAGCTQQDSRLLLYLRADRPVS